MSIFEVAKAAGVSTATVSRVLNEFPGVRIETVQLVRDAVQALNYTPLRTRRSRKKIGSAGPTRQAARTGTIAVVTLGQTRDWLQLPIMATVVAGIQRAAGEFGLRLMLDDMPDPLKHSATTTRWNIDGAIVFLTGAMPASSYEPVLNAVRQRVPIVWAMGAEMTAVGLDHVSYDNISTGYLAHEYLRSKGCKELAYLTVNPEWPFMRLRGQAFMNAAYDVGHGPTAYIVGTEGMLAESFGRRVVTAPKLEDLVNKFVKATPRPTGLFVANDCTTAAVYTLLAKRNVQVGRDVTIVSCDNERIRLSALHPEPASIDIGAEEVGFRSVVRLRARMLRRNDPPLLIQVAPRLVLPTDTPE